ncbi:MAG: glycosyltransferase [Dysgonamonadaceae bacterium]|jgi:glycosyltransferase involved in cell wall biosynthesis|nr:glycosyltransferase [Dysgonamonadaceae bacterium]
MNIAYLSTFYPFRGGIAQFNANLYSELKAKHEVTPYTFSRQYPNFLFPGKTQYVTPEDKAVYIDSLPVLDTINPLSYESAARRILKQKPDLLIMKYWMSFLAPSLGHVAKRLKNKGVKTLCVVDNAIPHEQKFFDRPLARLFFNQCTHFITMSEAVKSDLLTICPKANCCLIPHPLYDHFGEKLEKSEARKKLNIDPDRKTLLFFGLIRDYKGLDLLIEAMSLLDDSFQLIIAGECYGDFGKYQSMIEASPARQRILALNRYIGDDEVPTLFSAADLLVAPYRSATQSGVIPVACHFSLPALVTDVGGLRETVEHPGIGLVCRPQPNSIAIGINDFFVSDKELYDNNFRKVKEELSWKNFAEKLIKFTEK